MKELLLAVVCLTVLGCITEGYDYNAPNDTVWYSAGDVVDIHQSAGNGGTEIRTKAVYIHLAECIYYFDTSKPLRVGEGPDGQRYVEDGSGRVFRWR